MQSLAHAILHNKVHPHIYASFGPAPKDEDKIIAGCSDLMSAESDNKCAAAVCIDLIGNISVRVMYAIDSNVGWVGLDGAWNPKRGSKRLLMADFDFTN